MSRYLSRSFVTCVSSVLFILPLSFFKRLDALHYASSIGCVTILYVIWVIIYESLDHHKLPSKPMHIWPEEPMQVLQIVPIICFAYQVNINDSIKNYISFLLLLEYFICRAT